MVGRRMWEWMWKNGAVLGLVVVSLVVGGAVGGWVGRWEEEGRWGVGNGVGLGVGDWLALGRVVVGGGGGSVLESGVFVGQAWSEAAEGVTLLMLLRLLVGLGGGMGLDWLGMSELWWRVGWGGGSVLEPGWPGR